MLNFVNQCYIISNLLMFFVKLILIVFKIYKHV